MPKIVLTLVACLVAALGLTAPSDTSVAAAEPDHRPNIVVVMVDDLAAGPAERLFQRLPTIKDRFLDHGIRFTRAYGETPLCCPGRAGLLSGRHTHSHGVTRNHPAGFDQTRTIATALHDAGYWTIWVGKYFNNGSELVLPPPGWDAFQERPVDVDRQAWLASRAPELVAEAPADEPLFAVVSSGAPHNAKGTYLPKAPSVYSGDSRCQAVGRWAPPSYNEPNVSDKPAYTRRLPLLPYARGWPLRRHCEQLLWVDETVRRLEVVLHGQGRLRDTLWILISDNGMTYGEHRWPFKLSPYAARLPLWVSWPAGRGLSPRDEDALISNIDLAPSLAALGGAAMPWADGSDLSALLRDERGIPGNDTVLLSLPDGMPTPGVKMPNVPAWWGVRSTEDWLYVEWATGEKELYDLTVDPWKLRNRAADPAYAPRVAAMAASLAAYRDAP